MVANDSPITSCPKHLFSKIFVFTFMTTRLKKSIISFAQPSLTGYHPTSNSLTTSKLYNGSENPEKRHLLEDYNCNIRWNPLNFLCEISETQKVMNCIYGFI
jgi:hypothetical protein